MKKKPRIEGFDASTKGFNMQIIWYVTNLCLPLHSQTRKLFLNTLAAAKK